MILVPLFTSECWHLGVLILGSSVLLFYSIVLWVFCQCCFCCWAMEYSLGPGIMIPLPLFIFLRMSLTIGGLWCLLMNFVIFYISAINIIGILGQITLIFCNVVILTMFIILIYFLFRYILYCIFIYFIILL